MNKVAIGNYVVEIAGFQKLPVANITSVMYKGVGGIAQAEVGIGSSLALHSALVMPHIGSVVT